MLLSNATSLRNTHILHYQGYMCNKIGLIYSIVLSMFVLFLLNSDLWLSVAEKSYTLSMSRHLTNHVALDACLNPPDAMLLVISKPNTATFSLKHQRRKCCSNSLYSTKRRSIMQWHLSIIRCCRKGTAGCLETNEFRLCLCYCIHIYFSFKYKLLVVEIWQWKAKWKGCVGKLWSLRNLSAVTNNKGKGLIRGSHSPDRYLSTRLLRWEVYLR
jgi:hypothetical protein